MAVEPAASDEVPKAVGLTIIIPTSCGAASLQRCLDSLIGQDQSAGFEVVVVQFGMEDGTSAAIERARDRRPGLVISHLRVSAATRSEAKNAALAAASGEHVVVIHDDDRVAPGFVRAVLAVAEAENAIVVPIRLRDRGAPAMQLHSAAIRRQLGQRGQAVNPRKVAAALAEPIGIVYPRTLITRHGFDEDLDLGEDAVLLGRVLAGGQVHCVIPDTAAGAVLHLSDSPFPESMSLDPRRLLIGAQRLAVLAVHPTEGAIRRHLVQGVTAEANRYLRTHRHQHTAVVDDRRRRGLEELVDPRRLNQGVARDLAILYVAAPFVDTSANVAARRVLARRQLVDVVSNDMSSRLKRDPSSDSIWSEFVDQRSVVRTPPSDVWWPGVNRFCRLGLKRIMTLEAMKGPYQTVYSRAMHPTSHFLAAMYKLRRPQVRWLAEFSDPVRHDIKGELRPSFGDPDPSLLADFRTAMVDHGFTPPDSDSLFMWLETIAYAFADEITFTNENQRQFMLDHFDDVALRARAESHSIVCHHPIPEPALYRRIISEYQLPDNRINLAYFGVFYATRGLSEVWLALQRLPPAARSSLMLHVFTSKPDELTEDLEAAGLDDVVRANPYVSYLEYLNLATRVDALIVNDARTGGIHDINPYLPSKWSDYAGSGSEVWGISEPGSVLSGQPLDYRSDLGDVEGAMRVLRELIDQRSPSRVVVEGERVRVSVVVPTYDRPDTLPRTLESLARQTIRHEPFEVLVVANGPRSHVPGIVDAVRAAHPPFTVRLLETTEPGAARARNAGLAAAQGEYVTFVDDDDWVSPSYLEALLAAAEPGVVPLAWLADVEPDSREPNLDNYYSNAIAKVRGRVVSVLDAHQGISVNVCKLVPRALVRHVRYDETLASGEDFVFWTRLFASAPFKFKIIADQQAVYYRTHTPNSLSRRDLSFDFNVIQRFDCIRALDEIPPAFPDAEKLILRMMSGQVGFIRKFVVAHPDREPAVAAEYSKRAIGRLPWSDIRTDGRRSRIAS